MTFLFIIKPYMTFLFISSYLVPNFTVYDAVKNQVPKHFYDVPVYDFKYDLPVVFYDFPVKVILRCPRLYDVPVYDVPVYDCNSSYPNVKVKTLQWNTTHVVTLFTVDLPSINLNK